MPDFSTSPRFARLPVALGSVPVTRHNATDDPEGPFVGLMVLAAGDVKFTAINGETDTWTIPTAALPYKMDIAVLRVWDTGTTVSAGNVKGLK